MAENRIVTNFPKGLRKKNQAISKFRRDSAKKIQATPKFRCDSAKKSRRPLSLGVTPLKNPDDP